MRTNWAGNYTFQAPEFRPVTSVAEAQSIVAAADNVRVLGSGHSFNDIADSATDSVADAHVDRHAPDGSDAQWDSFVHRHLDAGGDALSHARGNRDARLGYGADSPGDSDTHRQPGGRL